MSERLKYIQSLKDQGLSRAEALEQLKIWDEENKPVEEVEKTEGVAESADVTPEPQAQESTELQSVELLSDTEEPEPVEVNLNKIQKDAKIYKRRADRALDKAIKQVPRQIDKDFVFDFGDENLNNAAKRISDNFFNQPRTKDAKLPRKLLLDTIKDEIKSNSNVSSYNSYYNDFAPITEDELNIDDAFYTDASGKRVRVPDDAELVAIRPVFRDPENIRIKIPQQPGMSPVATGEITETGQDVELVQEKEFKEFDKSLSEATMLKFKDADGNVYFSNYVMSGSGVDYTLPSSDRDWETS